MTTRRHTSAHIARAGLIAAAWLPACGARTENVDWGDLGSHRAGGGGSAGNGGASGSTGKGGSAGKGGSVGAGGSAGPGGSSPCGPAGCKLCEYRGVLHAVGDSFPAGDGCNTCSCQAGGFVACTRIACNLCSTLESEFHARLATAKTCNPALSVEQCTVGVIGALYCGCTTFVNGLESGAIEDLKQIEARYGESGCAPRVVCEPCAAPARAYCSSVGRCEDVF